MIDMKTKSLLNSEMCVQNTIGIIIYLIITSYIRNTENTEVKTLKLNLQKYKYLHRK